MHWNYRVVKRTVNDEEQFGIHEVYYGDEAELSWTETPVEIYADTLDDLRKDIEIITRALEYPVINGD